MRVRWFFPAVLALLALWIAPSAQAGLLVSTATSCDSETLEHPFLRWADPFSYTLAPGGSFEAGAPGWTLRGGAGVKSGNESYYVHGAGDSSSLAIPNGGSATSRSLCVGIDHPSVRFFARNGGSLLSTLKVDVLFEDSLGDVLTAPVGVVTGTAGWAPTPLPLPVAVSLLPLLPGNNTAVAFKFTPVGLGGSWQIDDVYVDPWNRR
jgi:hypothetical protein